VLAVPAAIGAILVAGWLLLGLSLIIPRFSTDGPVVIRNGVAAMASPQSWPVGRGKESREWIRRCADEPRTGIWDLVQKGECTVWYHHPPALEQRLARQERADH
jgi:hypothetical protein